MDDLLSEFLTETAESLDTVDLELVKFEQNPNNKDVLSKIFRLVHTVKGTCGFLGLTRLQAVAHASETLLGKFRDGAVTVSGDAVTLILQSLDRIKLILAGLEAQESEPQGDDSDLIARLDAMSANSAAAPMPQPPPEPVIEATIAPAGDTDGRFDAKLGRALKPGEVTLDELDAIFQAAEGPSPEVSVAPPAIPEHPAASASPATGDSAIAQQSIRINVDVIENLMTMVSELVLTRNQLLEMVRRIGDNEFKVPIQRLSGITAELQEGVMKTRMQPVANAWQKLPRIIRDLAHDLGKKIDLEMIGAETELDRQVLELIKDPLTHMVRNSADHGLEMPDQRRAAGKSETGKVVLKAYHEGGYIIIEVADDGFGLNTGKIRAKLLANGLASEAELDKMSEAQIHRFIFAPGFSTASKVTNVSGRGVGMDVVRTNIEQIGGAVDLRSVQGRGTTFTIKIPLTLAIVSALIVSAGGQRFAIPQLSVVELVRTKDGSDSRIERINRTPVLRLRDRLLPLVRLGEILKLDGSKDESGEAFIVVTRVGAQTFGIVVDEVYDTEEIVVKPMCSLLRDIAMFSGNTILGDGSVIMIVDPNGVAATIGNADIEREASRREDRTPHRTAQDRQSLLVFRAGGRAPKAVPLALVTRLEEIESDRIEHANGSLAVQYRGRIMPLVHADPGGALRTHGRQPVLVFTDRERAAGLIVEEIVDIVEDRLDIELTRPSPGHIGSAVICGKATDIVDIGYFLKQAYADWFDDTRVERAAAARRVLFVDDSPFFRNMVAPLLTVAGYDVTAVESADVALRLRDEGCDFDLIVSDIEMPGMNGLEFARTLRQDPAWGHVPMVALSSRRAPDDIERGRQAGFSDYVEKFDRDALIEIIEQQLKARGEAA